MPELISNLLINIGLLAGTILVAWLGFFLVSRGIKRRGQVVRSLDMELFLILIPREAPPEETQKSAKEKIQPMEQLYSIFSSLAGGGFWTAWEFGPPHVTWEIVFNKGEISFYAAVPSRYADTLVRAIHAVYSDAVVERVEDYDIFRPGGETAASYVVTARTPLLPLKTYQSLEVDPLDNMLTALAKLEDADGAAVQVIMRPVGSSHLSKARKLAVKMQEGKSFERALAEAQGSWLIPFKIKNEKPAATATGAPVITPQDQEIIKAIQNKAAKNNFEANIRLVVSSDTKERAEAILAEIEGAFSQFSSPELNYFAENRERMRQVLYEYSFRLFDPKRSIVLSSEELASVFHLPIPGTHLPKIKWLKARSAPAPLGMNEGILLGINEYRDQETPVRLAREDRRRHLYIVGQTGTGKTTMLQELIHQDIEEKEGLCVIDPHGDLIEAALAVIPQERWEDVIVFDPTDLERPLGLNMLEHDPRYPEQKTFIVDELINIFNKLYDLKATGGPIF